MPLNTQIMRDGEAVKLSWCDFHVAAMLYAIAFERKLDGTGPNANLDYPTEPQGLSPRNIFDVTNYPTIGYVCPQGRYVLENEHRFQDVVDGEVLHLMPGDELTFYRSQKAESGEAV
jgi:hypothetical protein